MPYTNLASPTTSLNALSNVISSGIRYKVKCRSNQVLSYSILSHTLEEPGFCGNSSACMDSLSLQFPGMGATETTCGRLTDSSTHNDGSSELNIEFNSNRKNERNGFLIAALCVDPRLTKTSSSRQSRSVEPDQAEGGTVEKCNAPAIWKRNGHEDGGHVEESDDHNGTSTDPALLKLVSPCTTDTGDGVSLCTKHNLLAPLTHCSWRVLLCL